MMARKGVVKRSQRKTETKPFQVPLLFCGKHL